MRSIVNCAVLTLVLEKPSYGAEIGRRFELRYGQFLKSRRNHGYRSLKALEFDGHIERYRSGRGSDRQPRAYYRITDRGRAEYRAWLASPLSASSIEQEMAVRLLSVQSGDIEAMHALLDAYQSATLAAGSNLELEDGAGNDPNGIWFRELERLEVAASLEWVRWARKQTA